MPQPNDHYEALVVAPEPAVVEVLAVRNGDPSWRLPVPARFVIDPQGIVRSAEADPDYRFRPEPEATVEALRKVVVG